MSSSVPDADIETVYENTKTLGVTKTLTPGCSIVIPKGWWHCVHNEPNTFALSFALTTKSALDLYAY
jgi:quercetin dioxygenase-like cupin family protein